MKREEILNLSRLENNSYDEREQNIYMKSSAIAKGIGVSIGFIICLIELIFFTKPPVASMAAFSVCFSMNAVEALFRFVNLKDKFNLIKSIIYSIFAIFFVISLIVLLCKGY